MKYLFFIVLLSISCQNEKGFIRASHTASKLDSITTEKEIETLIHTIDSGYKYFKLRSIINLKSQFSGKQDSITRRAAIKYGITKTFYKEDFDNNGFTDLLVIGDHHYCQDTTFCHFDSFVILNHGKDSLQIKRLVNGHSESLAPQIIYKDSQPIINIHTTKYIVGAKVPFKISEVTIPVIYKFDNFIELQFKPVKHNIKKIEFATSPCLGTCPVYQINIEENRTAKFIAQYYNFNKDKNSGEDNKFFTCTILPKDYNDLIDLLNYIDFEKLDNQYFVTHTDAPSVDLIITYDNGKIKKISDYGQRGSYGLIALYEKFSKLRFNQKWIPAKEPKGIRINPF